MGKDLKYDVYLRGEELVSRYIKENHLVFFQRPAASGGGFWLVRTYCFYYEFVIRWPVSLRQGIDVILGVESTGSEEIAALQESGSDDFTLSSPPSGEQA